MKNERNKSTIHTCLLEYFLLSIVLKKLCCKTRNFLKSQISIRNIGYFICIIIIYLYYDF